MWRIPPPTLDHKYESSDDDDVLYQFTDYKAKTWTNVNRAAVHCRQRETILVVCGWHIQMISFTNDVIRKMIVACMAYMVYKMMLLYRTFIS